MRIYVLLLTLCLFCQCTKQSQKSTFPGTEIDTIYFHPQFLSIVDDYVSCHSDYDSYLIVSSFDLAHNDNREYVKRTEYFIMPAASKYDSDHSSDRPEHFTFIEHEDLSFYIKMDNKPVYIKSDLDNLSSCMLPYDSLTYKIMSTKSKGEIWRFGRTSEGNFKVISKEAEKCWPGIIIQKVPKSINWIVD